MSGRFVIRGTAIVDITPPRPHPLGGFAVPDRVATAVHAPLLAQVIHLEDASGHAVVWVTIDALAIGDALRESVATTVSRVTGAQPESVIVVASHTHSAPSSWHGSIHPILPASLDDAEVARVAGLIGSGIQRSDVSVGLAAGTAAVRGVGSHRHSLSGPHDDNAYTVTLRAADGTIHAILFEYACHPTTLGPESTLYSPDWVHTARTELRVALHLGDTVPILFLPGSSADASTRFHRRARTVAETERLGGVVAAAAAAAVAAEEGADAGGGIAVRRTSFPARVRGEDATGPGAHGSGVHADNSRVSDSVREGEASLRALLTSADRPETLPIDVIIAQVGAWTWLHHPFELAARWGSDLTAQRPQLRVIGYSDAYRGYLADDESHAHGAYEASASFVDLAETERIIAQFDAVLRGAEADSIPS